MGFWERLDKYIRGGPAAVDKPFALLSQQEFEQQVTSAITERLGEHGFAPSGKRRWTRQCGPGILGLVALQGLKTEYVPAWGVSLDFVPHLSGGNVGWHRTPKSARFDLSYQPLDYDEDLRPWEISRFATAEELRIEARVFASRVSDSAVRFLEPLTSATVLLEAFEAKRNRRSLRLAFEHYPQEMLSYAFVLARAGHAEAARDAFSRFVESHQVSAPAQSELSRLLSEAEVR